MVRTFVGVELSSSIRERISALQNELRKTLPPMNWVRPESIHLTLKFLGYVESSRIPQIQSVLEPIGRSRKSFSITVQGLGVFPHIKRPRIFWIGVTGKTQPLEELVLEIETALEPLGFPPEEKAYHPHLTLARIKRENSIVGSALLKDKILDHPYPSGTLNIDRFILFQSDLAASGPIYTPLAVVPLSPNAPAP